MFSQGTTELDSLIASEPLILDPADVTHSTDMMSPDYTNFGFPFGQEFEIPAQLDYSNMSHASTTRDVDTSLSSPASTMNTSVSSAVAARTEPQESPALFMSPPPPPLPQTTTTRPRKTGFQPRAMLSSLILEPARTQTAPVVVIATEDSTPMPGGSSPRPTSGQVIAARPMRHRKQATSVTVLNPRDESSNTMNIAATFDTPDGRPTDADLREIIISVCDIDICRRSPMLDTASKCDVVWDCICSLDNGEVTIQASELATRIAGCIRTYANRLSAKSNRDRVKDDLSRERAMLVATIDRMTKDNESLQNQLRDAQRQIKELKQLPQ